MAEGISEFLALVRPRPNILQELLKTFFTFPYTLLGRIHNSRASTLCYTYIYTYRVHVQCTDFLLAYGTGLFRLRIYVCILTSPHSLHPVILWYVYKVGTWNGREGGSRSGAVP